ncbi:MAG: O-Antigen ligase, partial [Microbacteriaceae bacterium]|nr:O-Antigen ligase [Microbacteriaceae bacterium]
MTSSLPLTGVSRPRRGPDAVTLLTVYLVLLCALPSALSIAALGSIGRPATIWALGMAVWWLVGRIQRRVPSSSQFQPVRLGMYALVLTVVASFTVAMLGGIPPSQSTTATSGLFTVVGWAGVLLVACDGIATRERMLVFLRRIAFAGALLAVLGLVQFVTGQTLVDGISFPGTITSTLLDGLPSRAGFARASGTALHPLEYSVVLCVALPIAIAVGVVDSRRGMLRRVLPIVLSGAAAVLSLSRSAVIGLALAVVVVLPALSTRVRWVLLGVTAAMIAAVGLLVPGLLSSITQLFTGLNEDPSAISRQNGIDVVLQFVANSPIIGKGLGTFVPDIYIFDNAYILLAIELGVVGLVVFVLLALLALGSAFQGRRSPFAADRVIGQALMAAAIAGAVLFAFFDGLSFPQSAGFLFLVYGLCGAQRRIARDSR